MDDSGLLLKIKRSSRDIEILPICCFQCHSCFTTENKKSVKQENWLHCKIKGLLLMRKKNNNKKQSSLFTSLA